MADWILLTRIPSFYRCTSVAMLALLSACFVFAIVLGFFFSIVLLRCVVCAGDKNNASSISSRLVVLVVFRAKF